MYTDRLPLWLIWFGLNPKDEVSPVAAGESALFENRISIPSILTIVEFMEI